MRRKTLQGARNRFHAALKRREKAKLALGRANVSLIKAETKYQRADEAFTKAREELNFIADRMGV